MFVQMEDRSVKIRKVELSQSSDDGKVEAKVSFSVDMTEEEVSNVPELGKGLASIHEALMAIAAQQADSDDDGPNSVAITIRRTQEDEKYKVAGVTFIASLSGSPKIGMVDGGATMFWKVSGLIESAAIAKLAKVVGSKSSVAKLTVEPVQGVLQFEQKAENIG